MLDWTNFLCTSSYNHGMVKFHSNIWRFGTVNAPNIRPRFSYFIFAATARLVQHIHKMFNSVHVYHTGVSLQAEAEFSYKTGQSEKKTDFTFSEMWCHFKKFLKCPLFSHKLPSTRHSIAPRLYPKICTLLVIKRFF